MELIKPLIMKKILTILLATISLLSIQSCGSDSKNEKKGGSIPPPRGNYGKKNNYSRHRCGRMWNGELDATYGSYGDYCSERCYTDLYPN